MFDTDPAAARQSRCAALQRAASEDGLVGGYHFPFPGVGRMATSGSGYAFEAALTANHRGAKKKGWPLPGANPYCCDCRRP